MATYTRRSRRLRHGSSSSAAQASPLEDEDLLWEILLCLPPQPSSLPRASAVCKRWRRVATDPRFHLRFCQHHRNRKPPLLSFFLIDPDGILFKSVLDPPDRIPPQRFDLGIDSRRGLGVRLLGCRHGRLLIQCRDEELIVIATITGEECHLSIPPEFKSGCYVTGAVLCAAADHDHVHGSCHLSPFKVVLLSTSSYYSGPQPAFARVYSSETGIWSDLISTSTPYQLHGTDSSHGSLIGNSLYWMCSQASYIVEFDLDGQILALIRAPPVIYGVYEQREIIEIVDGVIGLAILSNYYHNIRILRRKVNCHGVTEWVLWKTIDMHNIHGIPTGMREGRQRLIFRLRYAEGTDDIFLHVGLSVYMVQLKSMQSKKLCEARCVNGYYPFKSFYMPGAGIARGCDCARMLHET